MCIHKNYRKTAQQGVVKERELRKFLSPVFQRKLILLLILVINQSSLSHVNRKQLYKILI